MVCYGGEGFAGKCSSVLRVTLLQHQPALTEEVTTEAGTQTTVDDHAQARPAWLQMMGIIKFISNIASIETY